MKVPKKPKITVLCGSSKYVDVMAVCGWLIERDECAITTGLHLLPFWYGSVPSYIAEFEGVAPMMDELHLRKIDMAEEVFVVNYDYYLGTSTLLEIEYAEQKGKKIRWFTEDPVGKKVLEIVGKLFGVETQGKRQ